jgi:hypothetical protein
MTWGHIGDTVNKITKCNIIFNNSNILIIGMSENVLI